MTLPIDVMQSASWIARRLAPACLVAATIAGPVDAHHSWAAYDGDHVITIEGVITEVEWANPHVVMRFEVEEDGEPAPWTMEMDPPTLLLRYGLRHDTITAGMTVKITGVRARTGARMMRAVMIELPDGTTQRVSSRV